MELTRCCLGRREALYEVRLDSYSKRLVEHFASDADTMAVLDDLSITQRDRENFEPIIPPLADLIHAVKRVGWARKRKKREAEQAAAEAEYTRKVLAGRAEGGHRRGDRAACR